MMVSGLTLASFGGGSAAAGSCLGGTYALANHVFAPDAFHPHFLRNVNLQSTSSQGLFLMTDSDSGWMNEADCGMAELARSDGSILKLNCAGGWGRTQGAAACHSCRMHGARCRLLRYPGRRF